MRAHADILRKGGYFEKGGLEPMFVPARRVFALLQCSFRDVVCTGALELVSKLCCSLVVQESYMHYMFGVQEEDWYGAIDARSVSVCVCVCSYVDAGPRQSLLYKPTSEGCIQECINIIMCACVCAPHSITHANKRANDTHV